MDTDVCVIREIEHNDYLSVAAIYRDAFGPLSISDESFAETCEKMQPDDRYHIFVAEKGREIVGFVSTVESLAINLANGYIKVNALAVLSDYRHCGIGKMLMERVEKLANDRNISLIGLASGFQRTDTHEFYEHLGYHKNSFWFSKRI